jgi:hypothetical protein
VSPIFAGTCPAHSVEQNEYHVGSISPTRSRTVGRKVMMRCETYSFEEDFQTPGEILEILDRQVCDLKI